jgi:hypothetical protein
LTKAGEELRCDERWCLTRGPAADVHFAWNNRTTRIRIAALDKWLADA